MTIQIPTIAQVASAPIRQPPVSSGGFAASFDRILSALGGSGPADLQAESDLEISGNATEEVSETPLDDQSDATEGDTEPAKAESDRESGATSASAAMPTLGDPMVSVAPDVVPMDIPQPQTAAHTVDSGPSLPQIGLSQAPTGWTVPPSAETRSAMNPAIGSDTPVTDPNASEPVFPATGSASVLPARDAAVALQSNGAAKSKVAFVTGPSALQVPSVLPVAEPQAHSRTLATPENSARNTEVASWIQPRAGDPSTTATKVVSSVQGHIDGTVTDVVPRQPLAPDGSAEQARPQTGGSATTVAAQALLAPLSAPKQTDAIPLTRHNSAVRRMMLDPVGIATPQRSVPRTVFGQSSLPGPATQSEFVDRRLSKLVPERVASNKDTSAQLGGGGSYVAAPSGAFDPLAPSTVSFAPVALSAVRQIKEQALVVDGSGSESEPAALFASGLSIAGSTPTASVGIMPNVAIARSAIQGVTDAAIRLSEGRAEVALSPEELGRVTIRMTQTEGGLLVVMAAERDDTHQLLRRHAADLADSLRAAGLGEAQIDFADRRDSPPGSEHGRGNSASTDVVEGAGTVDDPATLYATVPSADRLDIRL